MTPAGSIPLTMVGEAASPLFGELMTVVERIAAEGSFIGGETVEEFEREYAAWCEVEHAVGVSSGTDALVLALRALGVGPGDEVVVPANSFIATAECVSLVGATPRFADVEEHSQLMTAETLEPVLTDAVRCVIPVHLYGRTVDLDPIIALARKRGLLVLEDAAQAHGARYGGRRVGSIGDAGAFSFYPAKNLGAWGDGGAVVCRDSDLAERVALLRSHGESPRYHHRVVGTTARLDALQAAVLRAKLPHLEHANEVRRELAELLRQALSGSQLTLPPRAGGGRDHVYHQFVVRTPQRETLRRFLAADGIATGIHYPIPIHRSDAFRGSHGDVDVAPVASRVASEILSLPIFPGMVSDQVERIAEAVFSFDALAASPAAAVGAEL